MKFYPFGVSSTDNETSPEILGGKGAGLLWMSQTGVPVPPGFIIPTMVWAEYTQKPKTTMKEIAKMLPDYMGMLKKHFGYVPLVSVRSGARVSCPGMMDTILNVGIDSETTAFWSEKLGADCYGNSLHRLIVMYGSVVEGINRTDLDPNLMTAMHEYRRQTGEDFPSATTQLLRSIEAVFKSWDNDRAKVYRQLNGVPREWGTAVTVQAMVFGNLNEQSGTGVLFTRNPDTGECKVTGEFLVNAQGEDVVAGVRTPVSLSEMEKWNKKVHDELIDQVLFLEKKKKDVQDVEFTVQDGKLYILQTRNAKRSATAAIRIAIDMTKSGILSKKEAIDRVSMKDFDQVQQAQLDPKFKKTEAFKGIPACSGVVTGKPVFTKEDAIDCKEPCILVTHETTPDDIAGMYAAAGVITMVGGLTSHAAVVARSMNRAAIVGVGQDVKVFNEVDVISMDGATGRIWTEKVPILAGETNGLIKEFSKLVFDTLGVVPVIFDVPYEPLQEALLYLGDGVLHTTQAVDLVVKVAQKVENLYLDLSPTPNSPEAAFMELCEAYDPCQRVVTALEDRVIGKTAVADLLKKRLTLLGSVKTKMFKKLGSGKDLASLILADKEVALDGLNLNDPAIAKVMKWKYAEGVQVVSIGKYVEGGKSMLSLEQSLYLLKEVGLGT